MKLLPMNRSGLSGSQRLKAMIPLIVSVIALGTYLCVVNWRQDFVIHFRPYKHQVFYEKMIFAGLDRIRSSGWEMSWDVRHDEFEWIVRREMTLRGATNPEYEKMVRQDIQRGETWHEPPFPIIHEPPSANPNRRR
jgi:hypothetical protein